MWQSDLECNNLRYHYEVLCNNIMLLTMKISTYDLLVTIASHSAFNLLMQRLYIER